jgi:hypothetical protein
MVMPRIVESERYTLPPSLSIRWTARRKLAVVLAVSNGRMTLGDALRRYRISKDEFLDWKRAAGASLTLNQDMTVADSLALLKMLSNDSDGAE